MELIKTIVPVATIRLFGAAGRLICLAPGRLNTFAAGATYSGSVVERVEIHTVISMILYVHLRDAAHDPADGGDKVREPLFETRDTIDPMLALDVVAEAEVSLLLVLLQDSSQGIVASTVSAK